MWAACAGVASSRPIQSASELDYPPYSIVTKDGRADGFAVEMLRESLRAMGREVEFSVGPWHKIKQDLVEGRIQVLPRVPLAATQPPVVEGEDDEPGPGQRTGEVQQGAISHHPPPVPHDHGRTSPLDFG